MPANGFKHPVMMLVMWALLRSVLLLSTLPALSQGQITLDGSLGPRGPLTGPNYRIDANVGQIRGSNLFHSFGQFNVRTDESATFAGPNTITNIVGRVSGGEQSFIDGQLRSEIVGANLFLLNPSGIIFGPKASLAVSGSFHISTADFLRFADGTKFFANLGQESVLTVASPAAFGFLGNNPAAITIQGSSLKVAEGKALSAVGGDISIVGNGPLTADNAPTLGAPGGRIQLASVASPGEVVFSRLDLAPDLQVNSFTRLGRLEISPGAFLDASANGGGSVLLRSGRLRVDGAWIFADNNGPVNGAGLGVDLQVAADAVITNQALLTADSLGTGRAKDLRLTAGSVQIDNSTVGSRAFESGDAGHLAISTPLLAMDGGLIQADARLNSRGNAGSIEAQAGRLTLSGGAQISSGTRGSGQGGEVSVAASEAIAISGPGSGLFSNAFSLGDAGRLVLSAPTLSLDDGAHIQAVAAAGSGNAGNLDARVGRLTLSGGAQLDTSTRTNGRGGVVTVAATETISIAGRDSRTNNPSGLFAGRLSLSTPILTMDAGLLQTVADLDNPGNIGGLDVRVGRLTLTEGARISSSTTGVSRGADVTVMATDGISIAGSASGRFSSTPSGLFSSTFGQGDAGRLSISSPRLTLTGGAQISTITGGTGRGGDLTVVANDEIAIAGRDFQGNLSGLTTNTFGQGDAGRLSVSAPTLTLDGGVIKANASNLGNVGEISVEAGRLMLTGGASISSFSSGTGRGGSVTVSAMESVSIGGHDDKGTPSGMASYAASDPGRLSLSAPTVTIDGGNVGTPGFELGGFIVGTAGNTSIKADNLTLSGGARIRSETFTDRDGGSISIETGWLTLSGGAQISSSTFGSGDAGHLSISTPLLTMDAGLIQANAESGSRGNAGSIEVQARRLMLRGGAQISSRTRGMGRGGSVMVVATEAISMIGRDSQDHPSGLFSDTEASGDAGRLSVSAPRMTVTGGAQLVSGTRGSGHGGEATITASEALVISGPGSGLFSNAFSLGDAGQMVLSAPTLSLEDGALIQALAAEGSGGNAGNLDVRVGRLTLSGGAQLDSSTRSSGRGGTLTVAATDTISIAGHDSRTNNPSGLFSQATGSGDAGQLSVSAPTLSMKEGQILANTTGAGGGGDLALQVGRLALTDGAQISSSSFATGRGGNVTVAATEQLDLSTGGTISASSSGKGDAGSIVIQAGKIFRSRNGTVTTEADQADGGNIELIVRSLVDLRDSQLTATVKSGVGKGGNITIDPRFVILEGSQIRADAFGGPGGNIRIVSDVFLRDPTSLVSASSALGIQGTVDIRAPITSLSGVVAPLPQAFVSAATLLPARCAARLSGSRYSSLVVGGTDGLPLDPGSVLPSPLALDEWVGNPEMSGKPNHHKTPVKFALLAVVDKVLPRLYGGNPWGCYK